MSPNTHDHTRLDPPKWIPSVTSELSRVISNEAINVEYRRLVVSCSEQAAQAAPGQFFQLLCPHPLGEQPYLRRPMSVYAADKTRPAGRISIQGRPARARAGLATLSTDDDVDIMGPLGTGFTLGSALRNVVAIGRGAGLATLAPLAEAAQERGIRVTAILSARTPDLLVSVDRFRDQGAEVITVTDSEATSGPANVERILRGLIADGLCDAFYTCGSNRLMRVQQRLAAEFSLPGQIAMEQQMACGIGLCYCCVRDFNVDGKIVNRRVCWDGPVFDLMEALP